MRIMADEWDLLTDYSRGAAQPDHRNAFPAIELTPDLAEEDCMGLFMNGLKDNSVCFETVKKKKVYECYV